MLLVSCLNILCLIQGHKDFLLFSFRSFIILGLTFSCVIHFWVHFYVWHEVWESPPPLFLHMCYQIGSALMVKTTIISPLNCICTFLKSFSYICGFISGFSIVLHWSIRLYHTILITVPLYFLQLDGVNPTTWCHPPQLFGLF